MIDSDETFILLTGLKVIRQVEAEVVTCVCYKERRGQACLRPIN